MEGFMAIAAINPATGETFRVYEEMPPDAASRIVGQTHEAFLEWRKTSFVERSALMRRAAEVLRDRAKDLARLTAMEMGKPISAGEAEVMKCALACDFYADHAERFLSREPVLTEAHKSFIAFNPLGVILAVMPWNYPFWQAFRFAAPGLMAGNGAVLKHASNVPGCALAIEEIFRDAGFPENLFRTLLVGSRQVEALIEHPLIRAVTLTGSGPAGRQVAAKAGAMLKKTVLELGGSDAYLVLHDADLDLAATESAKGRLVNSGQSCIAAKRFIVVESARERYEALLVSKMKAAQMGDPLSETTQLGPLARQDLRDQLHRQVEASLSKGARLLLGGEIPEGQGAYYPPTVLTDVRPGMPAYDEELFGPVASVIAVKDEAAAIATANDSIFGLGGGVFTRDAARGEAIAAELIESGSAFVNQTVASDPRLPFGGIKESGYGRELSHFGIREFVNIKAVSIA
jgi:succinate-semialdehyde dehydrogenase / glutarate-semialdehyde dehydrogenase